MDAHCTTFHMKATTYFVGQVCEMHVATDRCKKWRTNVGGEG